MDSKILRVLSRLEDQSNRERLMEQDIQSENMLLAITSDTGMFFNIMLKAMRASKILEIGTSAGYSTLWFADAVLQNNTINKSEIEKSIITIDMNHSKVGIANKNFDDAGVTGIIDIIEGRAKEVLSRLLVNYQNNIRINNTDNLFDFVFIDADKENLMDYFDLIIPMVKIGGIIATDNMLYPEDYRPQMTKYAHDTKKRNTIYALYNMVGTFAMSAGVLISGFPRVLELQYGLNQIQSIKLLFLLYSIFGLALLGIYFLLSKNIELKEEKEGDSGKKLPKPLKQTLSPKSKEIIGKLSGLFAIDSGGFVIQSIVYFWLISFLRGGGGEGGSNAGELKSWRPKSRPCISATCTTKCRYTGSRSTHRIHTAWSKFVKRTSR